MHNIYVWIHAFILKCDYFDRKHELTLSLLVQMLLNGKNDWNLSKTGLKCTKWFFLVWFFKTCLCRDLGTFLWNPCIISHVWLKDERQVLKKSSANFQWDVSPGASGPWHCTKITVYAPKMTKCLCLCFCAKVFQNPTDVTWKLFFCRIVH